MLVSFKATFSFFMVQLTNNSNNLSGKDKGRPLYTVFYACLV